LKWELLLCWKLNVPKSSKFPSLRHKHTSIHDIQRCKGTQHKQSEILFPYIITIIIINNKSIIRSVWRTPISHNPSYYHNCLNTHSKQKEQYPNPPPHSPYDPVLFTPMDDVICIREERNIKNWIPKPYCSSFSSSSSTTTKTNSSSYSYSSCLCYCVVLFSQQNHV
jgi:hypothetical protein